MIFSKLVYVFLVLFLTTGCLLKKEAPTGKVNTNDSFAQSKSDFLFEIRSGTRSSAWNDRASTFFLPSTAVFGSIIRIQNNDNVPHVFEAEHGPCSGVNTTIPSGKYYDCVYVAEFEGRLQDHSDGSMNAFYVSTKGRALYDSNCMSCHGSGDVSEVIGQSASQIQTAILSRPEMSMVPALRNLTPAQIQSITGYLETMRPEPATPPTGNVVTFIIPPGTGSGSWNTLNTIIKFNPGPATQKTLRIVNNDSIEHSIHTNGNAPFPHPSDGISPGETRDIALLNPFEGNTYDHETGTGARIHISTDGAMLYEMFCSSCHGATLGQADQRIRNQAARNMNQIIQRMQAVTNTQMRAALQTMSQDQINSVARVIEQEF